MKQSITFFLVLSVLSTVVGLAANAFREKPLPFVYKDKAARLEDGVERIKSGRELLAPVNPEKAEASREFLPPAQSNRELKAPCHLLDYEAMKEIVENGEALVLDARPPLFYRLGHIPNSLSLPRDEFEEGYKAIKETLEADKNCPLVIYCANSTCDDSKLLEAALKRLGYAHISIYLGGWQEWNNKKGTTDEHR